MQSRYSAFLTAFYCPDIQKGPKDTDSLGCASFLYRHLDCARVGRPLAQISSLTTPLLLEGGAASQKPFLPSYQPALNGTRHEIQLVQFNRISFRLLTPLLARCGGRRYPAAPQPLALGNVMSSTISSISFYCITLLAGSLAIP